MTLETGVKVLAEAIAVDVKALEDGKVDKELGKGLSETSFTQLEKTKLADIASEATKNRADSLNADKIHTHTTAQVVGLDVALESKVDKETGKGLSTNDYSNTDKAKLASIASEATKNRADSENADKVHTHTVGQVTGLDAALSGKADKTTQVIAGTGLTGGGTLASNRTLAVSYGTAAGTAAQGNDVRIDNGQTAFGWGSHASAGYAKTKADVGLSGIPNTNASTANFLRGDGAWATPPNTNTTYTEITTAEIDAGTASTLRSISGRRMKYALDKKADTSTQVISGTGLTGGGNLSANRTLAVSYGTAAGTAAQGNDSRLSNSREWTASAVSQTEAQTGTAQTARKWTAQRVRQAILGWWSGSAEKTKLDGIEEGATNIPRITGSLTVTVGAGGNYPNISEALAYLMRRKKVVRIDRTTIQLLPGFVIDEQIIVRNTDLSWIIITSSDELITSTFVPSSITGHAFGYGSGFYGVFAVANGKLPLFYKFNYQPDVSDWGDYRNVFSVMGGGELNITNSSIVCTGTKPDMQVLLMYMGTARVNSTEIRAPMVGGNGVRLNMGADFLARTSNFRVVGSDEDTADDIKVITNSTSSGSIVRLIDCRGGTSIAPNAFVNGSLVLST